jgi:hypothetical protein
MRPLFCSEDVIEVMVETMCGATVSGYDKEIYREALRGLVRLAQAEQILSIQLDFNNLTDGPGVHH